MDFKSKYNMRLSTDFVLSKDERVNRHTGLILIVISHELFLNSVSSSLMG